MRGNVIADSHAFRLASNDWIGVDTCAGMELRVLAGAVWLTREGDTRDVVIAAGETFRFDGNGHALVEVLKDAHVELVTPARPAQMRRMAVAIRRLHETLDFVRGAVHAARARGGRIPNPL